MRRISAVLLFSAMTLVFTNSIGNTATIERFNPALLIGNDFVYDFMADVTVSHNNFLRVFDPVTMTWKFRDAITPQEMIRRFQERNPQAKIVGVDLEPSGSHVRRFHIYYIFLNFGQR